MADKKPIKQRAKLTASYSVTNAWANITGFVLTCMQDGYYDLDSSLSGGLVAANDNIQARFAINGNQHGGMSYCYSTAGGGQIPIKLYEQNVYLKKGDVASVQVVYNDAGASINYSAGVVEPYFQITKR